METRWNETIIAYFNLFSEENKVKFSVRIVYLNVVIKTQDFRNIKERSSYWHQLISTSCFFLPTFLYLFLSSRPHSFLSLFACLLLSMLYKGMFSHLFELCFVVQHRRNFETGVQKSGVITSFSVSPFGLVNKSSRVFTSGVNIFQTRCALFCIPHWSRCSFISNKIILSKANHTVEATVHRIKI